MQIIAFGHTKFVGKDTASKFLSTIIRTNSTKNVSVVGFADKPKQIAHDIYKHKGLKDKQYYEEFPEQKNVIIPALGKSARDIWIHVGNTLRLIDDYVWVDYPLTRIKTDILIFSDLRYPTEANSILKSDGFCIKLTNDRVPHTSDVADDALLNWNQWYCTIENNGSMNELYDKLVQLAIKLGLIPDLSKIKCHYCNNLAIKKVVWLKDKQGRPSEIKLPWCGCNLMDALRKIWPNPYKIMECIDYRIDPL